MAPVLCHRGIWWDCFSWFLVAGWGHVTNVGQIVTSDGHHLGSDHLIAHQDPQSFLSLVRRTDKVKRKAASSIPSQVWGDKEQDCQPAADGSVEGAMNSSALGEATVISWANENTFNTEKQKQNVVSIKPLTTHRQHTGECWMRFLKTLTAQSKHSKETLYKFNDILFFLCNPKLVV